MLTEHLPKPRSEATASRPIAVLLVGGDDEYASFVRTAFESDGGGLTLHHVRTLAEGLHHLDAGRYGAVLFDEVLPDGDAVEWLHQHRARVLSAVIVLTGDAAGHVPPTVGSSAFDFLLKFQVKPEHLVRAVRHAADRERASQELVESREYFQSLIEQARDLITVVDERGIIVYQSPASLAMLGRLPEGLIGRRLEDFASEDDNPRLGSMLVSLFSGTAGSAGGEFQMRHADGTTRLFDVVASRIPSADQRQAVINSRDVTERKLAEEALRARDEQLRQVMKMEAIGRLAGGIAHDFSNVLTVIIGACERLQDGIAAVGQPREDVDTILNNCHRASSLTRQLLAFSRKQTLSPQPLDLGELIGSSQRLLGPLIGEHIDLQISIGSGVAAVEADPVQMEQVLMNLAINARDAMPSGGVLSLSVRDVVVSEEFAQSHPPMVAGPFVLLEVRDTGCGMSAGTIARAFEPFFSTKGLDGTGLGLSTVYGIVKQSGGYIWIDSEPGVGTTFTIHMPPTDAVPVAAEPAPMPATRSRRRATILLTEDDHDVRHMLAMLLQSAGYTVLMAENPEHALHEAAAYHGRIDLLLSDVVMPRGTGPELAQSLTISRPETKVLFISGYPEYGTTSGSGLQPGVPFLAKPFTRDVLIQKINEVLS